MVVSKDKVVEDDSSEAEDQPKSQSLRVDKKNSDDAE